MFGKINNLKIENKFLKEKNERLEETIKEQRMRISSLEEGTCCSGKWCDRCEHHAGEKFVLDKRGVLTDPRPVCLKNVPCTDFVRREAPKPHD